MSATRGGRLGRAQAAYYLVSGAAPLVSYRLFEAVTGAKREPWLVKTVGLITVAIGWSLAADPAGDGRVARRLGLASAAGYAVTDLWYAGVRRRISPVYLVDAAVELAFVAGWTLLRGAPAQHPGDVSVRG